VEGRNIKAVAMLNQHKIKRGSMTYNFTRKHVEEGKMLQLSDSSSTVNREVEV
jgi:hypothetical protein